jgi:hypothetical protein
MGLFDKKQPPAELGAYEVKPAYSDDGKELPGVAGYVDARLPKKESMPALRFKFVRPDGRPD